MCTDTHTPSHTHTHTHSQTIGAHTLTHGRLSVSLFTTTLSEEVDLIVEKLLAVLLMTILEITNRPQPSGNTLRLQFQDVTVRDLSLFCSVSLFCSLSLSLSVLLFLSVPCLLLFSLSFEDILPWRGH